MNDPVLTFFLWVLGTMFVAFSALLIILLVVFVPAELKTQAECLAKGYPVAHVTYNLERYCSTLDGAVTVKVERQR